MDWACEACTFLNSGVSKCELCGAGRPSEPAERASKRAKANALPGSQATAVTIESDEEELPVAVGGCAIGATPQQQSGASQNAVHKSQAQHGGPSNTAAGLYVLDNCSCRISLEDLAQHVLRQLQTVQQQATGLAEAVACLACPKCCKHISSQDLYKVVGGKTLGEAYAALATKAKQESEQLHADETEPSCSKCPDGTLVLPAACIQHLIPGSGRTKEWGLPSKQELHAALDARQLNKPCSVKGSAALLAVHIGLDCVHFCTGCTVVWPNPAAEAPAKPSGSAATDTATAAAVEAALKLWSEMVQLQQVMVQGAPAAPAASEGAATRNAQQQQSKGRGKGKASKTSRSGGSGAWAAGTGYGGDCGRNTNLQKSMTAAANRQQTTDTAITEHLSNIYNIITSGASSNRQQDAAGFRPAAAVGSAGGVGVAGCAVLLGGPLAWLLRLLISNDSLMDVGGRQELYRQAMQLLSFIGSSPDLLPLLHLPADDPRDTTTAAPGLNPNNSSSSSTLMSALLRLQQQANLFRKSAADLMDDQDDEDTTAAVCLALDISSLVQDISEANGMFTATMVAEKGAVQLQPVPAAAGEQIAAPAAGGTGTSGAAANGDTAAAAAAAAGFGSSGKRRLAGALGGSSNGTAAAGDNTAAAEAQYVAVLRPYQFIEADLLHRGNHYFRKAAQQQKAAGGEVMRKRLRRITEELGSLSTSLPLSSESSILVACDSDRMDVLRALLLPHADTPYGGGAFLFDILLPEDYPNNPPKVQFLTTGDGRVRFNPNLYDCGKVCLSLLGTWSGPSWEPGVSTLLQVLVSLQSMVFVPDPYFNEPGYEREAKTPNGKKKSLSYNRELRLHTARHAILGALQRPDPVFKEALRLHYGLRGQAVLGMLQQWVQEAGDEKAQLQEQANQIKSQLAKLPKLGAAAKEAPLAHSSRERSQDLAEQQQRPSKRKRNKRTSCRAGRRGDRSHLETTGMQLAGS